MKNLSVAELNEALRMAYINKAALKDEAKAELKQRIDKIEEELAQRSPKIGQLVRKGKTVFYAMLSGRMVVRPTATEVMKAIRDHATDEGEWQASNRLDF